MANICLISGEDVSKRIPMTRHLENLGYKVTIAGSEPSAIFEQNNIPYIPYNLEREFSIGADRNTVAAIRTIFEKQPFDIVHAFDTKPTMLMPYALRGNKHAIKVVRTITGLGRIFTSNSPKNLVLRQVYSMIQKNIASAVSHTVFQNQADHDLFIKKKFVTPNKASVIKGSGIDLSTFNSKVINTKGLKESLNLTTDSTTFILVSRLVKQKGVLEYLKAARICSQKEGKYNFLLVGQLDTEKDAIPKKILEEYSDVVTYLGRREDIKELLSVSDIFVLPTYYREGVPRVLLEAAAMGLGLITTNMPGCNDVVKHNWNGLLVPIKDPKSLAAAMIGLAGNHEQRNRFKKINSRHINEFSLTNVMAAYHQLYHNLIDVPDRKLSLTFG